MTSIPGTRLLHFVREGFVEVREHAGRTLLQTVGVILRRPCLRGSCGGPEVLGPDGEPLTCATCPNRKKRGESRARHSLPIAQPEPEATPK